jgi:hypothetical protein
MIAVILWITHVSYYLVVVDKTIISDVVGLVLESESCMVGINCSVVEKIIGWIGGIDSYMIVEKLAIVDTRILGVLEIESSIIVEN